MRDAAGVMTQWPFARLLPAPGRIDVEADQLRRTGGELPANLNAVHADVVIDWTWPNA